ncbi:MAG: family 78 glycoside hydrolase catalytic domain [Clostridia bacterium]|nr:family 78 glycoside hydrolase catalytic domain [Clostridia bacterium]
MKQQEVFGKAQWLGFDGLTETPVVRASFEAKDTVKAEIVICGLGYFELYINGQRVSEDLFVPATSDYCHRDITVNGQPFDEHFRHRCYYLKYDVLPFLKDGKNELGAALGPGFFAQETWSYDGNVRFGEVRLCYRILLTDVRGNTTEVVSGKDARWRQGEVTKCNLFRGETHDLNVCPPDWATMDPSDWNEVRILPPMETEYQLQDCPADRVIRAVVPMQLWEGPRGKLYDLGENVTGWVILLDRSKKGETIEVRFGEMLDARGQLESHYTHNQKWQIVSDGAGRTIHPRFTWLGFRYFVVQGKADVLCAAVIHTDAQVTSSFRCASPVMNWLYEAYVRTQLDNLHGGIPSDCPHLERRGYTGDGQLTCESAMLAIDYRATVRKWMRDIMDCQDSVTGHVQNTAPYTRCGGGPGGWDIAIINVPLTYYRQYGDRQPLSEMYEGMVKYLEYLEMHSEGDLVVSDRAGEWCLGDWCTPDPIRLPPPYVNTYFKIKALDAMTEIDRILERPDNPLWKARREKACRAIVKNYYDPGTHDFAEGIQGANAFALDVGLGDEITLSHFFERYEQLGSYDTGIFGTEIVTRLLGKKGRYDLEYKLLTSEKPNSFGSMMHTGATTLWEYWSDCEYQRSLNHPMFGAAGKQLFYDALGIRQAEGTVGWRKVCIEPRFMKWLPQAEGHITTPLGKIVVSYRKTLLKTKVCVEIPEGVQAELVVGGKAVKLTAGRNESEWDV